ncbi:beta-glucosidase family protein [Vagococcus acidifermentans]|uniref:Fibronectin type III-like domain-containing protein n=1 Tax=Vagococcus acidifermentans TaxID=564710 RepID=A0A430B2D4_9ENTE|nr:glycoside hydrolase family 3 C-terminal domain-containing protein [Vagococcus acidifermentans]RSU14497.1 hypothetical protein CBF27_00485 [Vagococcus acidifermentans]
MSTIEMLLQELTLEEKIGMVHGDGLFQTKGVERLGIPPVKFSDGPMGVRKDHLQDQWLPVDLSYDYVTYFPSNSCLAATWHPSLAEHFGEHLGDEFRGRGKDVVLAPGINIVRSPLCGRNFEYISEDPYLTGAMAVPLVKGIQKKDVAASVKHFALNNQETKRLEVEVEIEDRALWEIYLPAFYQLVKKAGVMSIMGAYNRFRGEYCCESHYLLNDILRKQWRFDGLVVSDWGGVHNTEKALLSGLDIEMSVTNNFDEYFMAEPLKQAIEEGKLAEAELDKKVKNILRMMERLNMLPGQKRKTGKYNQIDTQDTILKIAQESVVLLKNEDAVLPISHAEGKKVLVVGANADRVHSTGGGSAEIKALSEITPLLGITMAAGGNCTVEYVKGYEASEKVNPFDTSWQEKSTEEGFSMIQNEVGQNINHQLIAEAAEKAKEADIVIFVGGLDHNHDTEGNDRKSLELPDGQNQLIEALLAVNPETILTFVGGSAVTMPWIDKAKAVVWSWYAGSRGGQALGDVLFGKVNPSGKLPVTFYQSLADCSAHSIGEFPGGNTVAYKEGVFVGYRYQDAFDIEPLFPFGHGLSYTQFEQTISAVDRAADSSEHIIRVAVANVGKTDGYETVQLYVETETDGKTYKELKGFSKVFVSAGQTETIEIVLPDASFARFEDGRFVVREKIYTICVGGSSRDIHDCAEVVMSQPFNYQLN